MSYTQVMARMYQASQVPCPPPRHLSEMAMTSRAADICTPACRNRARRPNLSAVQNETYVESCNTERQSELRAYRSVLSGYCQGTARVLPGYRQGIASCCSGGLV